MKYYFMKNQSQPVLTDEVPKGYEEATRDQLIAAQKTFVEANANLLEGTWPMGVFDADNNLISPVPFNYMSDEEKLVVEKLRANKQ